MTRIARVAASTVLAALCALAQASAAWHWDGIGGSARLDPARVFNANSESLIAIVAFAPRPMSPVDLALFNVTGSPATGWGNQPAFLLPRTGAGVAGVNLDIPRLRASYAPNALTASSPHLAPPSLNVPSPQPAYGSVSVPSAVAELPQTRLALVHFGTYAPYTPTLAGVDANVSVPVRLGGVHFQTAFHAMQVCGTADEGAACASTPETNAQSFSAGTSFNVRAGNGAVNVGLTSSIEHMNNAAAGIFPYVPLDPDAQAGLSYFGLTDVVSHAVGAKLAVPVTPRVTIGLQYDRAHYQGDYGTALLAGFDARKDTYLGNVTYQLPNTSSAITLSARQYRYQDAFAPNFNLTQTRADLNFTVKF